jgi:PDZ domain-containing secreted protein
MRKILLPALLLILGMLCVYASLFSRKEVAVPAENLSDITGTISNHTFTNHRSTNTAYYFWIRGLNCTFEIPSTYSYQLDRSVFSNSFQHKDTVTVFFDAADTSYLHKRDVAVLVKGMRSGDKIYLGLRREEETGASFLLFLIGSLLMIAGISVFVLRMVRKHA